MAKEKKSIELDEEAFELIDSIRKLNRDNKGKSDEEIIIESLEDRECAEENRQPPITRG